MSERDDMNLTPEQEQRIRASVRALGEVRADDAFRARLRAQFVSGGLAEQAPPAAGEQPVTDPAAPPRVVVLPPRRHARFRPWAMAALPAIAAVLAIVFLGGGEPTWQLRDLRGAGQVTVDGRSVETSDRATLAGLVASGARFGVDEGVEMDLVLGKVMVVGAAGPADFVLAANPTKAPYRYEATVNSGEFRFKSGPEFPGREMIVATTEGRAVITGTTVAVFKNADVTCVCVLEGTAMIGRDAEHMDAVPAGMRKVMFASGDDPKIVPIEPGHRDGLIGFEHENAGTFK